MSSAKRRRESDGTTSPSQPTAESHEAPTDHRAVIHAWLEDNEDGRLFSQNLEYALQKGNTSVDFKSFLVQGTPEDVRNILLGSDGGRVLRSIADLQARKHLDRADLVLEMFHDSISSFRIEGSCSPQGTDLVREAFTEATVASWGQKYYGSACTALWRYICYNFRPNPETPLTNELDNTPTDSSHYVVLFQSSGTGKSRLVDELAKKIFLIPICLRDVSTGYPPADVDVRAYLTGSNTRITTYARCWAFMQALFRHTATVLKQDEFATLDYSKTVTLFRAKMTKGMKKVHNVYRQNFFKEIVRNAEIYLHDITLNLAARNKTKKIKSRHLTPPKDHPSEGSLAAGAQVAQNVEPEEQDAHSITSKLLHSLTETWKELNKVLKGRTDSSQDTKAPRL